MPGSRLRHRCSSEYLRISHLHSEFRFPLPYSSLHAHCASHPGEAKVLFDLDRADDFMVIMEPEGYNVQPDRAFIARVEELCGRGSVRIVD